MSDTRAIIEVKAIGTEKAGKQFTQFENTVTRSMTASESSVARSFSRMAAQYLSMAYAMNKATKLMSSGVEFNKFVENQTMSFSVMMKSAEKAKAQMKDLYDFAVKSPLTFKETASSAKQLMAYGFAAKELIPTLNKLGTVALATGHSLSDIAYVYGTLRSQGRAYSRDLMQFGMRGIPIYEELAKVMGVNVNQIQKLASQGKIGFKEVERAFDSMTGAGGRFFGLLEQYMSTLTGKLAMLADIWEKSTGRLMAGATDSFKQFVDNITHYLESSDAQNMFSDLNIEIKTLADTFFGIIEVLIKLLPILTQTLKVFLAYKAITGVIGILKGLPNLLLNIGGALMTISSVGSMSAFFANLGAAGSLFVEGFVMAAPIIIGTLAPILAALKMIKDVKEDAYMMSSDAAFEERFNVKIPGDIATIQGEINNLRVQGLSEMELEKRLNTEILDYVTRTANKYGQTKERIAEILYLTNQISATAAKMAGLDIAAMYAKGAAERAQANTPMSPISAMEREMEAFSKLTGKAKEEFYDPGDAHAKGAKAARIYIEGFSNLFATEKLKWKELFDTDKMQTLWKNELEALTKEYDIKFAELGEAGLEESGFGRIMRGRIAELLKLLDKATGAGAKVQKLPVLSDWWLPEDSAVAKTLTAIDDVILAGEKALYNAQKEIDARREIMNVNLKAASLDEDRLKWQKELNNLKEEEKQIINDITKAQERLINVKKYEEFTGQSGGMFTMFEANAGASLQKAIDSLNMDSVDMSGFLKNMGTGLANTAGASMGNTEVGAAAQGFASGGVVGLIVTIVAKFITLIAAIENVGKSFDAITTIWESMKSVSNIVEIFNNAFEPITKHLEQVGEAIAPLIAVFVGLIKIANVFMYIMNSGALITLQILSEAFKWFYNSIIYPVGNMIVKIVNAIIKVLNKIPFVHIKYLDTLEKLTDATEDYTNTLNNVTQSLDATISYLEDKLREIYDKQLESIQELYEVGAISAKQYEKMVDQLNATQLDQNPLVSLADEQLNTELDILQRLLDLYELQERIDNGRLSDDEIAKLLKDAGLSSDNLSTIMISSITTALKALGLGTTTGGTTGGLPGGGGVTTPGGPGTTTGATGSFTKYKELFNTPALSEFNDYWRKQGKDPISAGYLGSQSYTAYNAAVKDLFSKYSTVTSVQKDSAGFAKAVQSIIALYGKYTASFAVGTGRVPQDMVANIHKDEGVIPKTFMDSIRSGELTLGGRNQASGQTTVININIEGTVVSERNLAESVSGVLYKMRSKGLVTV